MPDSGGHTDLLGAWSPLAILSRLVPDHRGSARRGVIIFVAGHETTAAAMTFVWYLLSKHPWAEAKLQSGA